MLSRLKKQSRPTKKVLKAGMEQGVLSITPFQGCMNTGRIQTSDTGMYALRERSLKGGER
jgi:hypothetical protein